MNIGVEKWQSRRTSSVDVLFAINVPSMRDHSHNNLSRSLVREVENSIITHTNAPSVPILELLAGAWKGFLFQREKHAGNTPLHRGRKAGQLLLHVATKIYPPAHARIRRSFSTSRNGV